MGRAIFGLANLTTSAPGVAKIEEFKSRTQVLAEDDLQDEFYRPAASSKPRPESAPRYRPQGSQGFEDTQEEEAFLRTRGRVPVRKSILPRTRLGQIALAGGTLAGIAVLGMAAIAARNLLKNDPRFRIDSSDSIQILGNSQVTRAELLSVFGSDIGRNVFFVPLADRRAALEGLPWVEHATVMRLLPNQMRVAVVERTPVGFVRTGNEIGLVDASGVVLSMPAATLATKRYSFPVVTGIDPADPLSTRTARMHIYRKFLKDLDAGGENISAQLSEVDLSDPEDVKAIVSSPDSGILLHFGDQDFLARFHSYQAHLAEWRQQYPHLASIDLRYERQVVLQMDQTSSRAAGAPENSTTTPEVADGEADPSADPGAALAPHDAGSAPAKQPAKKTAKKPVHNPRTPAASHHVQADPRLKAYDVPHPVASAIAAPTASSRQAAQ